MWLKPPLFFLFGPLPKGSGNCRRFQATLKNIRNKNGFSRICSLKLTTLLFKEDAEG
jgi:hypothetical protein